MTIASALTALNTDIQNARTAITNKGGTVTSGGGSSQLATDIATIPSGGGSQTKFGANINTFLGDVDANGVLQLPTEQSDLVFTGVKGITDHGLYSKFNHSKVKSVSFPNLTKISGSYGLGGAFNGCTMLTSVDLSLLTTVSGSYGLQSAFYGCTGLTSVDLSSLTTVSAANGLQYAFYGCTGLTSVDLSSLTTVSGNSCLAQAFSFCTGLTDIYFRALTTSSFGTSKYQFSNMMQYTGTSKTHTLHFPSNMESTISGLTGYPLFGGTSGYVVCAFDLPAT